MSFRIASAPVLAKPSKPKKEAQYLDFIRTLPCVVTGVYGVEAAHLSTANELYGHAGRAKGRKASDRWSLPLSPAEHRKQHSMNEMEYWRGAGIDPHIAALVIYGIWSEDRDNAGSRATRLILKGME